MTPDLTIPVAGSINSETPCEPESDTFHILYIEEISDPEKVLSSFSNKLALANATAAALSPSFSNKPL